MTVPFSYNIRNLVVRKTTTVMTAFGIALSVAILVASLALVNGLRTVFANTSNPLQLLVLRKGGNSELGSTVSIEDFAIVRSKAGIAVDRSGQPLTSQELVNVVNLPSLDNPKGMNVTVRGLSPVGIEMRKVRLVAGRWFQPGQREVVVGKAMAHRYPSARIAHRIRFGKGDWEIVGVMDGGQSALNSEMWGDFNQISADYNQQDSSSSVLIRATDPVSLDALKHSIEDDPRLNASTMTESDYYQSQTASGAPLEFLGIFVAVIMAIGSGFATTNIMYAAVARRGKEIGTLKALGFSEGSILLSFLSESVLLAALGGVLGCLIALPLNWVTTGVGSMVSFSEIAFRFHVGIAALSSGLIFAVVLGAAGGALPARAAAKKEILIALREA
ncbi:MAG TPA: ABC transporter permease [Candidatus Sulfotelmatobacter sp.]|jgi:ABC-type antimicrobial peptide transport system permease subunit|nr:ABC transporter permease [Candidatus Sulfotelmatobacter sp.]